MTWPKVLRNDGMYRIQQEDDDDESYWLRKKTEDGDWILCGSAMPQYDEKESPTGLWVTGIYKAIVYIGPDEQKAVEELWKHRYTRVIGDAHVG